MDIKQCKQILATKLRNLLTQYQRRARKKQRHFLPGKAITEVASISLAGATLGTAIVPVIGTGVGAVAGLAAGVGIVLSEKRRNSQIKRAKAISQFFSPKGGFLSPKAQKETEALIKATTDSFIDKSAAKILKLQDTEANRKTLTRHFVTHIFKQIAKPVPANKTLKARADHLTNTPRPLA